MFVLLTILLIAGAFAQDELPPPGDETDPTAPPRSRERESGGEDGTGEPLPQVDCPMDMCSGKADGNYEYNNNGETRENYFVSCIGGNAYCQPCFPLSLVFKEECNQCVYSKEDSCYTTQQYTQTTLPPFDCPSGKCPGKDEDFSGNVADTNEKRQYIACWKGMITGCVSCPPPLLFNEEENACLYEGKYVTEPSIGKSENSDEK